MKAFLFSDIHVSYKQLDNLKKYLKDKPVDLLIFAGDFVNMGEPIGFANLFRDTISEISIPFHWVPGNNDFGPGYHKLAAKFPSLEGRIAKIPQKPDTRYSILATGLTGVGGSPASWSGQYAGEKMIDQKDIAGSIFVSHVPPPGVHNYQKFDSSPPARGGVEGGGSNKKFSNAPLVHICGHIHHQWGIACLGQIKLVKLAAFESGHYAIMDLETLFVEFGRF